MTRRSGGVQWLAVDIVPMQDAAPYLLGRFGKPEQFAVFLVDDALVDSLAEQGIAYVPYFPLGGFTPLQSDALASVASRLEATPMAVALAWLLQRSPNILLIPGTSSVAHLRDNVAGAGLTLPEDAVADLNAIAN